MRFKYTLEHLNCSLCTELHEKKCPHQYCPHILEHIDDLFHDPDFIAAVKRAGNCKTLHRPVLLLIGEITCYLPAKRKKYNPDKTPLYLRADKVVCSFKTECETCTYPRHGFQCYSSITGRCLKVAVAMAQRKEGNHGGGY